MKIVEWLIAAVLWICGALSLVFLGWMLKAYQSRRENV
jgi:hypothetical protein